MRSRSPSARSGASASSASPRLRATCASWTGFAAACANWGYASFADAGGLLAYGANRAALYGRVGYFVDRIFKGATPGDIPFERAAKFDTIINLKTAKALGITIPPTVRLRADRVIE